MDQYLVCGRIVGLGALRALRDALGEEERRSTQDMTDNELWEVLESGAVFAACRAGSDEIVAFLQVVVIKQLFSFPYLRMGCLWIRDDFATTNSLDMLFVEAVRFARGKQLRMPSIICTGPWRPMLLRQGAEMCGDETFGAGRITDVQQKLPVESLELPPTNGPVAPVIDRTGQFLLFDSETRWTLVHY